MAGIALIKEELRELKQTVSPEGDRFAEVMEVRRADSRTLAELTTSCPQTFLPHAAGAIEALQGMGTRLSADLDSLLLYYGEHPKQTTPEAFFTTIVTFSLELAVSSAGSSIAKLD